MDFTKIDNLNKKLKATNSLNKTEIVRLREEFMIENTYDSIAIGGNTLTLRETALVIKGGITIAEKSVKEHLEAIGHKDALEYVTALANKNTELTTRIIKEIHSYVLMSDAAIKGAYRRIPVSITGASHTPPQPYLVPVQMEALIGEFVGMKQNMHIIEALAEFHLRFESIHPFLDGNGRVGRLIINMELIKAGLLPVNIKFKDRIKYYNCFDNNYYINGKTSDALAELIAECETEELLKYLEILEQKANLEGAYYEASVSS